MLPFHPELEYTPFVDHFPLQDHGCRGFGKPFVNLQYIFLGFPNVKPPCLIYVAPLTKTWKLHHHCSEGFSARFFMINLS